AARLAALPPHRAARIVPGRPDVGSGRDRAPLARDNTCSARAPIWLPYPLPPRRRRSVGRKRGSRLGRNCGASRVPRAAAARPRYAALPAGWWPAPPACVTRHGAWSSHRGTLGGCMASTNVSAITISSVVVAAPDQVSSDLAGEAVVLSLQSGRYYGLARVA